MENRVKQNISDLATQHQTPQTALSRWGGRTTPGAERWKSHQAWRVGQSGWGYSNPLLGWGTSMVAIEPKRCDETAVKVGEIIKIIEADGWFLARTRGSHRQFKHSTKPGLVTVAGKPSSDLAPGTQRSILRQAQIDE